MKKIITFSKAAEMIPDGASVMFGGFMANGSAERVIDALVARNVQNLTIICNDSGWIDRGVGKLIVNKQCARLITSHIGLNKETGRQMNDGELAVELVPQGTLAEQIRAGGYGLGGVLTRTGLGTLVAEGKQTVDVDGVTFLLEKPLRADFAVIFGSVVDKGGNITYKGSTNNFNNIMATAADVVILEAEKLVEIGQIDPNAVITPGIFVDYIAF
ncbi:MAG: CoA transferase subunit A [Clostridiales bacterium]|jgi:acetate CoA/acetoacetate CoA-transferase alpha subunit|nr:CoA transferase subunit A [Clostridiales bacterium]